MPEIHKNSWTWNWNIWVYFIENIPFAMMDSLHRWSKGGDESLETCRLKSWRCYNILISLSLIA
jgi:hypothetical protein